MTSRIIARMTGTPWLIQSEALETMIQIASRELPDQATIDAWKNEASRRALATRAGDPLGNSPSARVRDGVAIIPIAGPIFRHANLFTEFSGATALADFAVNLAAARADSRVRGILLEIDSPGGDVTGLSEAAGMIAAAAGEKPTTAYVEGSAHSAAYWLATAASAIVLAPTATIGSLGAVVAMQIPSPEAEARSGVRRYRFVSTQTPNKLLDPTTDAGAARLQALADRLASEFLTAAATARGMTVDALLAATDGGGLVMGADAVAAGLADDVAGFEATLARLAAGDVPKRSLPPVARASADEPTTEPETGSAERANAEDLDMSTAQPAASAPPPDTTAQQAAEAAKPDPIAAERARCAAITAATQPGFAKLSAMAIAAGWSLEHFTEAQAASADAIANARAEGEKAALGTAGEAFRQTLNSPVAGNGEVDPAPATPEEKACAEYAASPALQAEFGGEGAYLAYVKAVADGKVRVLANKRA